MSTYFPTNKQTVEDNEKLTVLLLELGDPGAKYREDHGQELENVSVDINLLSRWDVSTHLNNEQHSLLYHEKTSDRGLKILRKRCQNLLTRLLTTVSD